MTETSPKARTMLEWVLAEWADKLAGILESMADERPMVEPADRDQEPPEPGNGMLVWEQSFVVAEGPLVWIATPQSTVLQIGERTLRASGVDEVDPTDAQNTFWEVLSQSLSALGQSLSTKLARPAASTAGGPSEDFPQNLHWMSAAVDFADARLDGISLGCSSELLELLLEGNAPKHVPEEIAQVRAADAHEAPVLPTVATGGQSKTFDLLLDVSLSVSVSFGRTFLPVRDVLKLTTGSIVELDRAVNEPVEIIVNNCVIARGEVVVVEGNYGVRISQIASRHDRLRTGSAAAEAQHALSAR